MGDAAHLFGTMAEINMAMIPLKDRIRADRNFVRNLLHIFAGGGDFSQTRKTVYDFEDILCIFLLLALKGKFTSFDDAAYYMGFKSAYFRKLGLVKEDCIPLYDTVRRIFMYIDSDELRDAIVAGMRTLIEKIANGTARGGSRKAGVPGGDGRAGSEDERRKMEVFNILDASSSLRQASIPLEDVASAMAAFQSLLGQYRLGNTMVTGDALSCRAEIMEMIVARGGHYTFAVGEEQPAKQDFIVDTMRLNHKKIKEFRQDNRDCRVLVLDRKLVGGDFPHAGACVAVHGHRGADQADGTVGTSYFVSSATNPLLVAEAMASRCFIEGDFSGFGKLLGHGAACALMDKEATAVMAVFSNVCYALCRLASPVFGHSGMSETRLDFEEFPEKMMARLLPRLKGLNLAELLGKNLKGGRKKVSG